MPDVEIVDHWVCGSIGRTTELHAAYYRRKAGFGLSFECQVATELSAFLEAYDAERDRFAVALVDGRVEGAIAIDGTRAATNGAHLRWFVVSEGHQGRGVGQALMEDAIDFCRSRRYGRVYLWTFEGLDAARHVYEKNGFELVEQAPGARWGREVNEQRWELRLP